MNFAKPLTKSWKNLATINEKVSERNQIMGNIAEKERNMNNEKPNIMDLLKNEKVEWKTLGEVCEFHRGTSITQKNVKKGEVPVIGGGQTPAYYHNKSNREGVTITIAGSGAYAGYVSYWTVPIFLSDAFSIEPDININKRYLYHWLLNNQYRIYELKKGSGIAHVYGKDLGKFKIPIPSIETQEKIVKILDKFTKCVTELQTELQKRTSQYEFYRDKLLNEEYLKELSKKIDYLDSQRELRVTTLGEIGEFINGSGMPKILFNENGSVGAIHYGHIYTQYNIFVKNPIVKIHEEDAKTLKKVNFGDLVIARTSENIDDVMKTVVYLGEKEAVAGGHTVILKHNENGKYLSYLFNGSHDFIKQKNRLANGVKVIEVSLEDMKKIKITLPSIEIQNIVVQILDQFQKLVMDTKGLLPKEIEERQKQYEYYREKLLTFTPECGKTDRPTDRPTDPK